MKETQEVETQKTGEVETQEPKRKNDGYHKTNHILQIAISGLMVGLAILVGYFGHFPLFGGHVYLLAAIVFLFPIALKLPYMLLSTIASVLVVDGITGYISFTWITLIAYIGGVLIIWGFKFLKFKFLYSVGVILASAFLVLVFYILEMVVFDQAYAIKDAIATSIQMAIVIPIVSILYWPLKIAAGVVKL